MSDTPGLARLLERARALEPRDPQARACFALVIRGLEQRQLGPSDLAELVSELALGHAPGFEELLFEPRGKRLQVRFLDVSLACERDELLPALEALRDAVA